MVTNGIPCGNKKYPNNIGPKGTTKYCGNCKHMNFDIPKPSIPKPHTASAPSIVADTPDQTTQWHETLETALKERGIKTERFHFQLMQ